MRATRRVAIAAATSALVLGACGGGNEAVDTTPTTEGAVVMVGFDTLKFDKKSYTAKAGTITIDYVNDGVLPHTVVIEDEKDFKKLSATKKGERVSGSVTLDPGTYTIYCDVAGHRAGGMEAKLVVT
jgi:plastocyanin